MKTFREFLAESKVATDHGHTNDFKKANSMEHNGSSVEAGNYGSQHEFDSHLDHGQIMKHYINHIRKGDDGGRHDHVSNDKNTSHNKDGSSDSSFNSHSNNLESNDRHNTTHYIQTTKKPNGQYHHVISQEENLPY